MRKSKRFHCSINSSRVTTLLGGITRTSGLLSKMTNFLFLFFASNLHKDSLVQSIRGGSVFSSLSFIMIRTF